MVLAARPRHAEFCLGDRPFLAWLLRECVRFGVEEFLLLSGPLSERVRESVAAATLPRPAAIDVGEAPASGRLRRRAADGPRPARRTVPAVRRRIAVRRNLATLLAAAAADADEVVGRIMLRPSPDASRHGMVETEGDVVRAFREPRRRLRPPCTASAPASPSSTDACSITIAAGGSLERDVLAGLARRRVAGDRRRGALFDIGFPEDLPARVATCLPGCAGRRCFSTATAC